MERQGEVFVIESNNAGNGLSAILQAQERGYKTHFLTSQPEKYASFDVNPMKVADSCTQIDTNDVIKLLHFFADKHPLAILTFDDFHVFQAAIVSAHHGLVHAELDGLINVRFKDRTRACTNGIGRSVPYAVRDLEDAGESSPIGVPCVVKPLDESGSTGVRVCYSEADYQEAIRAIAVLDPVKKSGYKRTRKLLIEEYIEGIEYSAEMMWDTFEQEWQLIGFTTKETSLPYCLEVGHTFPFTFGEEVDGEVVRVLRAWLKALHFTKSAAHIEFKRTPTGEFALVEVNPRPAGGRINELVRQAHGRDIVASCLDLYLGVKLPEFSRLSKQRFASIHFLVPKQVGTVLNVLPPEEEIPGVAYYNFTQTKKQVKGGTTTSDLDIGCVITVADRLEESYQRAKTFCETCRVEYE